MTIVFTPRCLVLALSNANSNSVKAFNGILDGHKKFAPRRAVAHFT